MSLLNHPFLQHYDQCLMFTKLYLTGLMETHCSCWKWAACCLPMGQLVITLHSHTSSLPPSPAALKAFISTPSDCHAVSSHSHTNYTNLIIHCFPGFTAVNQMLQTVEGRLPKVVLPEVYFYLFVFHLDLKPLVT